MNYQRQRQALLLLKYLARGDRDYRHGNLLTDSEADQHFRARREALKPGA